LKEWLRRGGKTERLIKLAATLPRAKTQIPHRVGRTRMSRQRDLQADQARTVDAEKTGRAVPTAGVT